MTVYFFVALCLLNAAYVSNTFDLKTVTIYQNIITMPALNNNEEVKTDITVGGRIINGKLVTSIKQFPYQVKLVLRSISQSNDYEDVYMECGGSIISPDWILTAAHCLEDTSGGYILVGCLNTADPNCQRIDVLPASLIQHENYIGADTGIQNDIGLVKLPSPVTYTTSVNQIKLNRNPNIPAGKQVVLSGYGLTETGQGSDVLRYTSVSIVSNEECQDAFPFIQSSVICYGAGTTSACQGDSGGPMTMIDANNTVVLVGVTSFGTEDCLSAPGVYTRVSSYLTWICTKTAICY